LRLKLEIGVALRSDHRLPEYPLVILDLVLPHEPEHGSSSDEPSLKDDYADPSNLLSEGGHEVDVEDAVDHGKSNADEAGGRGQVEIVDVFACRR
jgi:hypothetical protein